MKCSVYVYNKGGDINAVGISVVYAFDDQNN